MNKFGAIEKIDDSVLIKMLIDNCKDIEFINIEFTSFCQPAKDGQ